MRSAAWAVFLAACAAAPQRDPSHGGEPAVPPSSSDAPITPNAPNATNACSGHELELENVMFAPSCTIAEADAAILQGASAAAPKLEASVLPDRRVLARITNPTAAPMTLVFASHSAVDRFPVRAQPKPAGAAQSLVAATASFSAATGDLGIGWHYARAILDPGGSVSVRLTIEEHVETVDYAGCPPDAKCAPRKTTGAPLPKGAYALHIGVPLRAPGLEDPAVDVEWIVK